MLKEPPLIILLLLLCFPSIAAVLFTPALPEISRTMGISSSEAQLTMTVFLVGYALGNLPWGPISNRFGRKPAIYMGIALTIVGCLLVVFAGTLPLFGLFLTGRFLMALGSSVGMKIAFTMIGDVYQHQRAAQKMAYTMLAFAIGPSLSMVLGGFLTEQLGWQSCFYFLACYSALLGLLALFLPETCLRLDPRALNLAQIKEGYAKKLKNKKLVYSALLMGCGTSFVYVFATMAPFVGIDFIGLKPETYGLLNFIPPVGMIIGSLISRTLAGKRDPLVVIFSGIVLSGSAATIMACCFFWEASSTCGRFFSRSLFFIWGWRLPTPVHQHWP